MSDNQTPLTPENKPLVLVIEDDPSIASMCAYALEHFGYRVQTAATLAEGSTFHDSPDAAIIDVMLHGSMNGIEVAQAMRDGGFKGRLVAMSASSYEVKAAEESGLFKSVLPKPFNVIDLPFALESV